MKFTKTWVIVGLLCRTAVAQQPQALPAMSVGIVFDTSGSMGGKLQQSRQVVGQFLKAANSQDEFSLVQFNDHPAVVSGFSGNTNEIQKHLTFIQAKGRSALLDAIYLALQQMKTARNARKALLVISDGGDNSSLHTRAEINSLAREAGIRIYGIGIYESLAARGRTSEELAGPALLSETAEQTDGNYFAVEPLADLPGMAAKVAAEMRARM